MLATVKTLLKPYISNIGVTGFKQNNSFSERIKRRHEVFWQDQNAEAVRNTIMHAHDPIEKWKDVTNWQRKLSNKYNSREFAVKHGCKRHRF
jgi:hypothetical protein